MNLRIITLYIILFLQLQFNDWFDCLNVRVPYTDNRERMHGFGLAPKSQFKIIDEMSDTIFELRVKGKKGLMPFQKGEIQKKDLKIMNIHIL